MNFELRQYQKDFLNDILKGLKFNQKIIACSATGSGKTKTFVALTHKAISNGKTVLILTESKKIFTQICSEFTNVESISSSVTDLIVIKNQIYIGMAQTLANRGAIINQFARLGKELIIINDEAHIGTATKLLIQFKNSYIIGFTATPRWKEAPHLTEIYRGIAMGKQPQWLIENGYLAPYYHLARTPVDLSQLQIKNGEFTGQSQNKAFDKTEVYQGLLNDLTKLKYYKCMIFCANKAHADKTSNTLRLMGVDNVVVHTSNDLADEDLKRFEQTNDVNVCVSVGMLTKGYDFPPVDLVILNRATTSLPLYLQMIGRGSRICKGKNKFTVVDYGNNFKRFGLWNIERAWDKLWNDIKLKGEKDEFQTFDTCEGCGFILLEKKPICPNCGMEQDQNKGQKPTKEKEIEGELIDITGGYNEIRGKMISSLSPNGLKLYMDYTGQINTAIRLARTKCPTFFNHFCNATGLQEIKPLGIDKSLIFEDFEIK
jgi:superfamily II DNA or RNA helicase